MDKTLHNTSIEEAKENIADLKITGNGDMAKLLCKASSVKEGWMKSTKAIQIDGYGCIVQVTTHNYDNIAEAVCFIPGVEIKPDENGGNKLVKF